MLRKIDRAVDFNKIYEFVEDLYRLDNGRPSIDPVILFKMVLIQHLYGIRSLLKVADEVSMNVACRWFLGYTLNDPTPHFSTLSYNFRNRFNSETIDKVLNWILEEIATAEYLNPEVVFIDETHIKVNANVKKKIDVYDEVVEKFPKVKTIVADSAYKTPWISKRILDDGRIPVLPYKRQMSKKGFFKPYEYVYDKYYDCVICPENQVLSYATTNRDGYQEFKSKRYICKNCPSRYMCTENEKFEKTVIKHIWFDYLERVEDIRHTPKYQKLYERRKETIERVFADAKEKHAMRYTPYRGLTQVTNWVRLKFAAMNLKKFAIHRWNTSHLYEFFTLIHSVFPIYIN